MGAEAHPPGAQHTGTQHTGPQQSRTCVRTEDGLLIAGMWGSTLLYVLNQDQQLERLALITRQVKRDFEVSGEEERQIVRLFADTLPGSGGQRLAFFPEMLLPEEPCVTWALGESGWSSAAEDPGQTQPPISTEDQN